MDENEILKIGSGDKITINRISDQIVSQLFNHAISINCKLIRLDHYTYYFKNELYKLRNERIDGVILN